MQETHTLEAAIILNAEFLTCKPGRVCSLWFVRCFSRVDRCIAQFFPSQALLVYQWGSLCFKLFLRTSFKNSSWETRTVLVIARGPCRLVDCGPCFSKQQLRRPKRVLPQAALQRGVGSCSVLLHCSLARGGPHPALG